MGQVVRYAVVQKRGQVTIPIELRRRLGMEEGGLVAMLETEDGILISRQVAVASQALDQIGEILKEKGISLEDLIESGREIRQEIYKEKFAPQAEDEPPSLS